MLEPNEYIDCIEIMIAYDMMWKATLAGYDVKT